MITRPMHAPPVLDAHRGHSDATMTPLRYLESMGPHGGYPAPVRRTRAFAFNPRVLPPVNVVSGPPRLYG